MNFTERDLSEGEQTPMHRAPSVRTTAKTYFDDIAAQDVKDALFPLHTACYPIEELIATGEAVFEFINNAAEMELNTRNAFLRLEKQFDFYKNLIERKA